MTLFDASTILCALALAVLSAASLFIGEDPGFYTETEVRRLKLVRVALILVSLGIIVLILLNA